MLFVTQNKRYNIVNKSFLHYRAVLDFTNGSNKQKLVDRLQVMCQMYERPCLIVETDRQSRHGDQTVHKPLWVFSPIYFCVCQ